MQKLMTKAIAKQLPALYAQENVKDPVVFLKLFNPSGAQTFYITEGSEQNGDWTLFGFMTGAHSEELGYFSLNEIAKVRGAFGLGIERDIHFAPAPASTFRKK